MKSEVIIGLIARAKSLVSFNIHHEKREKHPRQLFITQQEAELRKLEESLDDFYHKAAITDEDFDEIVRIVNRK